MNEVQIITEDKAVAVTDFDAKETAIQWLTSTGNLQKFTEQEKSQFIDICCAFKLNPIKREVYGIKYGNNFSIVLGYEIYLKRAERTGKLDGYSCEVRKMDNDLVATCTVYRKDWTHPFVHSVLLSEYHQHNKMWNEKPVTMIKKVCIEQSFRLCFPDELGGLPYGEEELPTEQMSAPSPNVIDVTPVTVSAEPVETVQKKSSPKPKYTQEQALQIKNLVEQLDSHGLVIFSEEDKNRFRQMLVDGQFEQAKEQAEKIIKEHKDAEQKESAELDAIGDQLF